MTPEFALNLSHDGIGLLYRSAGEWTLLGQVLLDAPDFSEQLMDLHARAAKKAQYGVPVTKLIIPASQVLYTTVPISAPDDATRQAEIMIALDGLTPYAVADVVFDWCPTSDPHLVRIAVVAKETLREAEAFAEDWGFNPASFVAVPAPGAFDGEPWFGQTETATAQLGAEEGVERDAQPVPLADAYAAYLAERMAQTGQDILSEVDESVAFNLFDTAIANADASQTPAEKSQEAAAKGDALRNLFALGEDDWSDLDEADQPMPDAERIAQWRAGKPSLPPQPVADLAAPAPTVAPIAAPPVVEEPVELSPAVVPQPEIEPVVAEVISAPLHDSIIVPDVEQPAVLAPDAVADAPEPADEPMAAELPPAIKVPQIKVEDITGDDIQPDTIWAEDLPADTLATAAVAQDNQILENPILAEDILPETEVIDDDIAADATADEQQIEDLAPPLLASAGGGAARAALSHRAAPRPIGNAPRLGGVSRAGPPLASPRAEITLPYRAAGRLSVAGPNKRGKRGASLTKPEPRISASAQAQPPIQLQTSPLRKANALHAANPAPEDLKPVRHKPRYMGIILVALLILCMTLVAALADGRAEMRPDTTARGTSLTTDIAAPAPQPVRIRLAANGVVEPTAKGVVLPQGITLYSGRPGRVPAPRPAALQSAAPAAPVAEAPAAQAPPPQTPTASAEIDTSSPGLRQSPRPANRPAALDILENTASISVVAAGELAKATQQAVSVSRHPAPRPRNFKNSIDQALASAIASEPAPVVMAAAPAVIAAPVAPVPAAPAPTQQTIQLPQRTQPAPQQPAAQPATRQQQAAVVRKPDPTADLDEPEPTEALRKMPTSASVAKQATQKDALALRDMNLIGLYGAASNRRALVRMPNGRMIKVAVGDILDGGRVTAIGDGQLTYQKGVRLYQLKMMQGS